MSKKGKRKPCFSSILDSEDDEEIDDAFEAGYASEQSIVKESDDVLRELSNSAISSSGSSLRCRINSVSENGSCSSSYLDSAYDSVSSPGGSSTASGPTYIRPAGFENHAHEVIASSAVVGMNESSLCLRGRHVPINKKNTGNAVKSSKISSKSLSSSSSSSRKTSSSNSPSPNQSCESTSPVSSASSTSSSTSSREPLILRGVKKKKALLLSASNYSEEAVINNGKNEKKSIGGNNRRNKFGSNTPIALQNNHQRPKHKKEPLPMKQRALPQSFWQEPNIVANSQSPGSAYSTLPPLDLGGAIGVGGLSLSDDPSIGVETINALNSITSMEELPQCEVNPFPSSMSSSMISCSQQFGATNLSSSQIMSTSMSSLNDLSVIRRPSNPVPPREKLMVTSTANTDLLFSLFNSVEEEEAQRRIHVVRRGRPKKVPSTLNSTKIVSIDDDPCLNSIVTESILPLIPDRLVGHSGSLGCPINENGSSSNDNLSFNYDGVIIKSKSGGTYHTSTGSSSRNAVKGMEGTQVIKITSISNGDRSVELPSLNVEHNYPHLLSELVMKL